MCSCGTARRGTTELVFAEAVGEGYLQWGRRTSVSDDGRFVFWYYLLRDRQLKTTTYVPMYSDKASGASYIQNETMSGNGRFIVWTGWDDVEPGDTNGWQDIWLRDLRTGSVERLSVDRAGQAESGPAEYPHISSHGRYVAFTVAATYGAWRPPLPGGWEGVYVRDRQAGTLEYASVDNDGGPAFGVQHPSISPDGMFVAFRTEAPLGDPGALYNDRTDDIYVHERGIVRTPIYDVLAPTKLDFGDRVLGTSVTRRVFLQNRTPSFLVVRDFTILGTDRQLFTEDDARGWYLLWPNDTLTVRVTFKASTLGPKSAYLRLPVDTNIAEGSTQGQGRAAIATRSLTTHGPIADVRARSHVADGSRDAWKKTKRPVSPVSGSADDAKRTERPLLSATMNPASCRVF